MKWDMAGAGTVVGLMAALAGRKAKVDAVGLVGLVENMPSGNAQRPGDVVKSYSGQTIEVINTDAEGRLVLADVLWYCQEKFDPRFMVDLATLTGAMIVALGHEYAGMFSNDDALAQKLAAAGQATAEKLWRFPLDECLRPADQVRHRRHEEHRRPSGGIDQRGAVHPALRQRQALGTSRHRRRGMEHEGRAVRAEGRHSVSACGCWIGWWPSTTKVERYRLLPPDADGSRIRRCRSCLDARSRRGSVRLCCAPARNG